MYEFLTYYRGSDGILISKGTKKNLPDTVGVKLLELGIVKRAENEPEKRRRRSSGKAPEAPQEDKMMRRNMTK